MPLPSPACVAASPNGITSTGSGKRPRTSTHLVSSAITIMRSDAAATIFSRNSAPPPPLIRLSAASISSAPSIVRSRWSISSSVVSGIPQRLGLARASLPRSARRPPCMPAATFSPSRSTKCFAVEPVPSPSFMPSLTCSSARAAACRFNASMFTVHDDAPFELACRSRSPVAAGGRISSVVWRAGNSAIQARIFAIRAVRHLHEPLHDGAADR